MHARLPLLECRLLRSCELIQSSYCAIVHTRRAIALMWINTKGQLLACVPPFPLGVPPHPPPFPPPLRHPDKIAPKKEHAWTLPHWILDQKRCLFSLKTIVMLVDGDGYTSNDLDTFMTVITMWLMMNDEGGGQQRPKGQLPSQRSKIGSKID